MLGYTSIQAKLTKRSARFVKNIRNIQTNLTIPDIILNSLGTIPEIQYKRQKTSRIDPSTTSSNTNAPPPPLEKPTIFTLTTDGYDLLNK